jgi:hypothetical protein
VREGWWDRKYNASGFPSHLAPTTIQLHRQSWLGSSSAFSFSQLLSRPLTCPQSLGKALLCLFHRSWASSLTEA